MIILNEIFKNSLETSLILMVSFFLSCSDFDKSTINSNLPIPKFRDSIYESDLYLSPKYLLNPNCQIIALRPIGEEIDVKDTSIEYNSYVNDFNLSDTTNKSIKNKKGLKIYIDTEHSASLTSVWNSYSYLSSFRNIDNQELNNNEDLQLIKKYNIEPRLVKGNLVYVTNESKEAIRVETQDNSLFIIQEALNQKGEWQPIERWLYATCGNSYGGNILKPNYLFVTKIIKYIGNYKTKLRVKLKNSKEIVYSEPFEGSINVSQLDTTRIDKSEFFIDQ